MNYLDYLAGNAPGDAGIMGTPIPENYVMPMEYQPTIGDITALAPIPVPELTPAPRGFGGYVPPEATLNRSVPTPNIDVGELLTPSIKPTTSSDISAAPNPFPRQTITSTVAPTTTGNAKLSLLASRGGTDANAAIAAALRGQSQYRKDIAVKAPVMGEYEAIAAGADKAYDVIGKETAAYQVASDNLVNEVKKQTEEAQKRDDQINSKMINDVESTTKMLNETIDEKVDPTIDPKRYWANAGTGNKVLMGISMIFAAMTPETTRLAINSLNQAIDRDIDAQKQTILGKMQERKEKMSGLQTKLDSIYKRTGSELAATETARARQYQIAGMILDQMSKKLTSKESLANAEAARANLKMNALTARQNAVNAVYERQDKLAQVAQAASFEEAKLRMEKAKMENDKLIASAKLGGIPNFSGDILGAQIQTQVPPKQIPEAIKETGYIKTARLGADAVDDYFNRFENMSKGLSFIPGTEASTIKKMGSVLVFGPATELAKGALQIHEFKALVEPFLPEVYDSEATLNWKKNQLKRMATIKALEKTPTLDRYGVQYQNLLGKDLIDLVPTKQ